MLKKYALLILFLLGMQPDLFSQEIKIFKLADFDLRGNVKSCLVRTDYGKEEFDFDKEGRLTKSVTRYSDQDYDITRYRYENEELIEKRVENYRDNVFDKSISIANFYTIDSLPKRKITEEIISYTKEFLERNEYHYDTDGNLVKIVHTDNDGVDETAVTYETINEETTQTFTLNGVVQKSVRTSSRTTENDSIERLVLTKKFVDGAPYTATEEIYNAEQRLVSQTEFKYDEKAKQLIASKTIGYDYDALGTLVGTATRIGNTSSSKTYIYQFDNGQEGENANWIKQIITPENAYSTRRVKYYQITPTSVVVE
ncbi:hypothetical protein [uncultured Kriegella sp.]|uniref:hypothetical protein n=1 Tax=uncultured Kriegella sp. TaxID=1798910 RepID=UPI0030DC8AFD|tara:strand:+ start:148361 stop:149299 length:939 start_codon:yes stop_codon:yes gene_type:complete